MLRNMETGVGIDEKHCADTIFICHWHHVILVKNLANIHYLNAIYPNAYGFNNHYQLPHGDT